MSKMKSWFGIKPNTSPPNTSPPKVYTSNDWYKDDVPPRVYNPSDDYIQNNKNNNVYAVDDRPFIQRNADFFTKTQKAASDFNSGVHNAIDNVKKLGSTNIISKTVGAVESVTGAELNVGRDGTMIRMADSVLTFTRSTFYPIVGTMLATSIATNTVGITLGLTATTLTGGIGGLAILLLVMVSVQIAKRTKGEKALQGLLRLVQVVCVQLYITNAIINELSSYFDVPLNQTTTKEIKSRIDSLMKYVFGLFHIQPEDTETLSKRLLHVDLNISGKFKYAYRWINQNRINSEIVNGLTVINSLYSQLFSQLYFELMEKEHRCTEAASEDIKCKFISIKYAPKPKNKLDAEYGSNPQDPVAQQTTSDTLFLFNTSLIRDKDAVTVLSILEKNFEPSAEEIFHSYKEAYLYWTENSILYKLLNSKEHERNELFTTMVSNLSTQQILVDQIKDGITNPPNNNTYETDGSHVINSDRVVNMVHDHHGHDDGHSSHHSGDFGHYGGSIHTGGGYYRKKIATQLNNVFKKNEMLIRKMAKRVKPKRTRNKRKYRKLTRRR